MTTNQAPAVCNCGIEPTKLPTDGHKCQNEECIVSWVGPIPCVHNWNHLQEELAARDLEIRREAFEAGRLVEVNMLNGQPMSTFQDYLSRKGDR